MSGSHRGQGMAEAICCPEAGGDRGGGRTSGRAVVCSGSFGTSLRRKSHWCGDGWQRQRARSHEEGSEAPRARQERGRARRTRLTAPGNRPEGRRREGRRGDRGRPDLRDRGDKDGKRNHAPAAGKVEELNVSEGGAVNSGDTI